MTRATFKILLLSTSLSLISLVSVLPVQASDVVPAAAAPAVDKAALQSQYDALLKEYDVKHAAYHELDDKYEADSKPYNDLLEAGAGAQIEGYTSKLDEYRKAEAEYNALLARDEMILTFKERAEITDKLKASSALLDTLDKELKDMHDAHLATDPALTKMNEALNAQRAHLDTLDEELMTIDDQLDDLHAQIKAASKES